MAGSRTPKPLTYSGPGTTGTLPMDEIAASTGRAKLSLLDQPYKTVEPELSPIEKALAQTMFEYLTSDPTQRTFENALLVAGYLHIGFAATNEALDFVPPNFYDWDLIYKLSEAQMTAALGLVSLYGANSVGPTEAQSNLLRTHFANTVPTTAALHEALAIREQRVRGGKAKAKNDPRSEAMVQVKAEFDRWKRGEVIFTSNAKFAMEMVRRYPIIENSRSIENKCPEWERARRKNSSS